MSDTQAESDQYHVMILYSLPLGVSKIPLKNTYMILSAGSSA